MPRRVLIVDDNSLMRDTLHRVLGDDPALEITAEAECGPDALVLAEAQRPDVIVFDLNMPDTRPFNTIRELREVAPDSAILVFTASECATDARDAMLSGASGFLRKDAGVGELIAAVLAVGLGSLPRLAAMRRPIP